MSEWIKWNGSDEQIAEMRNCKDGFLIRIEDEESCILNFPFEIDDFAVEYYLICQRNPLADMICQQARTGQPVYWGAKGSDKLDNWSCDFIPWNQHEIYDYSFTEFKEKA